MAYHPTKGLLDYFGGIDDLHAGILRCVGVPEARFDEDALRILRALRFAAALDFSIAPETAAALHTCAPLLQYISGERILSEFRRMLIGTNAAALLSEFADIIAIFYPPLAACQGQKAHIAAMFAHCHTAETRLAAILCLSGCTDTDTIRKTVSRLPMERRFIDEVTALAADAARLPPRTRTEMRRRMSTESVNHITDQLTLHAALFPDHAADCETAAALCTSIAASDEITRISQLAVNGRDLAAENIRGRAIGDTLQMLLDAVIDGYTENTRDALLSYLKTQSM
jgi:tRNA nucleotidyltransferase (CCA-adding enzyme)